MTHPFRTRAVFSFVVAGALVLAACSPGDSSDDAPITSGGDAPAVADADLAREPGAGVDPPAVEASELMLPIQSEGADLVDPGWEVAPQQLGEIFMAPVDAGGYLEFTAIDASGQALWALERPLACAGFTLTTGPGDLPIAVINDAATTDTALAATTASAYDLRTGELVWGPVEVPGPHQGPGLIYAAPSPAMGESGPRVALSPVTGEIVADEANSDWSVIAENHGTVLLSDGTNLRAQSADGIQLWESALPDGLATAVAAGSTSIGAGVQALRAEDGTLTILDLASGAVLVEHATSAAVDQSIGMLIATNATETFAVSIETGETQWSTPSSAAAQVVTAGGAMAYVRDRDAIRVQNTITGDVTPGYPESLSGVIGVPLIMTGTGTAAYPHGKRVLLATEPAQ